MSIVHNRGDLQGPPQRIRLAIVVTHPIQYFAPLYRALTACDQFDLTVFYCSRVGVDKFYDPGMGVELAWTTDLLHGYTSVFLPGAANIKSLAWCAVDNPKIGAALSAFDADSVLIHGYTYKTLFRALVWCNLHGTPAMMVADSSVDTTGTILRRAIKRVVFPRLLNQFRALLTLSERGEAYFKAYRAESKKIFRVPAMIDPVFWKARERRAEERQRTRLQLGITDAEIVLVYVGKLFPRKRVGDIIEAMRVNRLANIHLLVVGDGIDRSSLERVASSAKIKSTFIGFINLDALAPYYCAGDILVHPAELEPYGMIAVEASVIGLPMILSDQVGAIGATSIARSGENTIVYPCGDVGALAAAIKYLVEDPEARARMGEASLMISLDHNGFKSIEGVLAACRLCLVDSKPAPNPN